MTHRTQELFSMKNSYFPYLVQPQCRLNVRCCMIHRLHKALPLPSTMLSTLSENTETVLSQCCWHTPPSLQANVFRTPQPWTCYQTTDPLLESPSLLLWRPCAISKCLNAPSQRDFCGNDVTLFPLLLLLCYVYLSSPCLIVRKFSSTNKECQSSLIWQTHCFLVTVFSDSKHRRVFTALKGWKEIANNHVKRNNSQSPLSSGFIWKTKWQKHLKLFMNVIIEIFRVEENTVI